MPLDKIFVFALVVFFLGFAFYCAWNSKQNEKKNREAANSLPGPDPEVPLEAEKSKNPRRSKQKKETARF